MCELLAEMQSFTTGGRSYTNFLSSLSVIISMDSSHQSYLDLIYNPFIPQEWQLLVEEERGS